MRYKDLKDERDEAVARALEAERLSMKSEFDRVTAEFEAEKAQLIAKAEQDVQASFRNGFDGGVRAMASLISADLIKRSAELRARDQ